MSRATIEGEEHDPSYMISVLEEVLACRPCRPFRLIQWDGSEISEVPVADPTRISFRDKETAEVKNADGLGTRSI